MLNPATPYGDCSLIRMANLHANVLQMRHPKELQECFAMRTALLGLALVGASCALAEPHAVTPMPRQTIYLEGDHDLQWLRRTNPDHYARAIAGRDRQIGRAHV